MNLLGDTEEQELLRRAARQMLARECPRALLDAVERGDRDRVRELRAEMAALGWLGLAIPAAPDAAGATTGDVVVLCEELGRVLCPLPYVATAVVAPALLQGSERVVAELRAGIASGDIAAVPVLTGPGGEAGPEALTIHWKDGRLYGRAGFVVGGVGADAFVVAARDRNDEIVVAAAERAARVAPVAAMAAGVYATVEFDGEPARCVATGWEPVGAALDAAATAEAAWCAGAAGALLTDTVAYARERRQFGVPIGSFQAVQQLLADCDVAVAEARTLAAVAGRALDERGRAARRLAASAFLRATEAFVRVARACHQVWGGMGYSTETAIHHYSRRARTLRQAWGGPRYHRGVVVEELGQARLLRDWYRGGEAPDPPTPVLDPGVEEFRDEVRAFVKAEFDPVIPTQGPMPQMDTPEKRAFVAKLAQRGWLGLTWPVEYGGCGRDELYQLVLQEELEYMGLPSMSIEVGMIGQTLLRHGSDELKREFLPRILRGELNIALGYSEPQAGSDLAALELRAVRDGDDFVLQGQKMWTSAAHFADFVWLACRTNTEVPRHRGISLFLVELDLPGIEVQRIDTMGDHRTNAVFFDGVRIPARRLVGEVDRGWHYLMEALDYERLRGFPFGALQRDLDELVAWARRGQRWREPAVHELLAEFGVRVEAARTHLLRSWDRLLAREVPTFEATMLKLALTETRQDLADAVIEVLGAPGVLRAEDPEAPMEGRFEHNWRAEIITTIAGGASEIQRTILATRHLGLPAGPAGGR